MQSEENETQERHSLHTLSFLRVLSESCLVSVSFAEENWQPLSDDANFVYA